MCSSDLGRLIGRLLHGGIPETAAPEQRLAWSIALAGFFQLGGVELAQERFGAEWVPAPRFTWSRWVQLWQAEQDQQACGDGSGDGDGALAAGVFPRPSALFPHP